MLEVCPYVFSSNRLLINDGYMQNFIPAPHAAGQTSRTICLTIQSTGNFGSTMEAARTPLPPNCFLGLPDSCNTIGRVCGLGLGTSAYVSLFFYVTLILNGFN